MPAVARGSGKDSVDTGHACDTTTKTDKCSADVLVNNIGACRKGDQIKKHNQKVGKECVAHIVTIKEGSASVFANNKAIARNTDAADAGNISSGSSNVFAGSNSYPSSGPAVLVNSAPVTLNNAFTITKQTVKTFSAGDFKFADEENNTAKSITITTLPALGAGTLTFNNKTIKAGQIIPINQVSSLKYIPNKSSPGIQNAAIGFKLTDTGGTANKGKDTSTAVKTISITVKPR